MTRKSFVPILAAAIPAVLLVSCVTGTHRAGDEWLSGESMVLVGEEPSRLAFNPLLSRAVDVRSTYLSNQAGTVHYTSGRDYILDDSGLLRRTAASRIPDFRTNILFGKEQFRHENFPGYGNRAFFVYVDYFRRREPGTASTSIHAQGALLPETVRKLGSGQTLRLVAFGDSITAGGEASQPSLIFWQRWADALKQKYPQTRIETVNGATGGDTTAQGLQRLEEKVLRERPDLVLVAFGMNDHNREGYGVPLDTFAANLKTIIKRIRSSTQAEVILLSTFPPNPKWYYGSHNMEAYARMTENVARDTHCAYVDVYGRWMKFLERKKPEDVLANNINHPNDFGHWIYFEALQKLAL